MAPRCEWGQIDEPAERGHQAEKVVPSHVGARNAVGLGAKEKPRARRVHGRAGRVKCRVRIGVGGRQHGDNAPVPEGERHLFAELAQERFVGMCRTVAEAALKHPSHNWLLVRYCSFLNMFWKMSGPQMDPRA